MSTETRRLIKNLLQQNTDNYEEIEQKLYDRYNADPEHNDYVTLGALTFLYTKPDYFMAGYFNEDKSNAGETDILSLFNTEFNEHTDVNQKGKIYSTLNSDVDAIKGILGEKTATTPEDIDIKIYEDRILRESEKIACDDDDGNSGSDDDKDNDSDNGDESCKDCVSPSPQQSMPAIDDSVVIIYKENGRFYEIPVNDLVKQLESSDMLVNPHTNEPISGRVTKNLKNRFSQTPENCNKQQKIENITKHIIESNELIADLYDTYLSRLEILKSNILGKLQTTNEMDARQQLNDLLETVTNRIHKLRDCSKSIDGLMYLIDNRIKYIKEDIIDQNMVAEGVNLIYPHGNTIDTDMAKKLQEYVDKLYTEKRNIEAMVI